ncbi:MAG TPA: hypothetical protein VHJ20_23015 [Polyangia bacterium]|nr:hypothetical protein [Polyangia bacterium]
MLKVVINRRTLAAFVLCGVAACSSGGGGNSATGGSTGGGGTTSSGGGTTGGGGTSATGGSNGNGATTGDSGGTTGGGGGAAGGGGTTGGDGGTTGGSGGTTGNGGAGGTTGTGGTTGGGGGATGSGGTTGGGGSVGPTSCPADPPTHAIHVTATGGQVVHNQKAGLDTRATALGKLAVELGVDDGSYVPWLGKRGYHVIGVKFTQCSVNDWTMGRDVDDKCRHTEWLAISASVKSTLTSLAQQYTAEDWGYFLNAAGDVRWSDVVFTGMSHGATTAAYIARVEVCSAGAVSRSGPRDNTCGIAIETAPYDMANPPWHPVAATCDGTHCCLAHIAQWIDAASKTPMNRFYGLAGVSDVEYGDIMFNMNRTGYPGAPVEWDMASPSTFAGNNRFYSSQGGHLDFLLGGGSIPNTNAVLNLAFGVPTAAQNPAF